MVNRLINGVVTTLGQYVHLSPYFTISFPKPPQHSPKGEGIWCFPWKFTHCPCPPFSISLWVEGMVYFICASYCFIVVIITHFHQIFWWKKITIYFWIAWLFYLYVCVVVMVVFFSPFNVCSFIGFDFMLEFYCYQITKDVFKKKQT